MTGMLYLSRADALAAGALDWTAAVEDICETVCLMHSGEAGMIAESVMPLGPDPRDKAYGLPAFVGGAYDAAGLKWTLHRARPSGGLPSILSTTLVNRLSDGAPLGMAESALLTRIRTAAVSAVAIRSLMPGGFSSLAILGAGAQAETHLDMVLDFFPEATAVHLWNRTPEGCARLIEGAREAGRTRLVAHASPKEALADADVVLCCTSAPEPFLGPDAVRPGRLIVQVGFHEVRFETIAASDRVTVDLWGDFAEKSAKSLFQMYRAGRFDPSSVAADLDAMVVGGWRPPRGASLYFSSFGLNTFDIALAARLLRQAERAGIGTRLPAV